MSVPNIFTKMFGEIDVAKLDENFDYLYNTAASFPTGMIGIFSSSAVPTGWLKCNGASLSTASYNTLFNSIGYTFGGSGNNFNLPDLRGEFVRGWDDSRGIDSGRTLGSAQAQDWKTLYLQDAGQNSASNYTHDQIAIKGTTKIGVNDGTINLFMGQWANASAHLNGYWGSEEIRPRNVSLLFCIKY